MSNLDALHTHTAQTRQQGKQSPCQDSPKPVGSLRGWSRPHMDGRRSSRQGLLAARGLLGTPTQLCVPVTPLPVSVSPFTETATECPGS